jgi:hypothetical protein
LCDVGVLTNAHRWDRLRRAARTGEERLRPSWRPVGDYPARFSLHPRAILSPHSRGATVTAQYPDVMPVNGMTCAIASVRGSGLLDPTDRVVESISFEARARRDLVEACDEGIRQGCRATGTEGEAFGPDCPASLIQDAWPGRDLSCRPGGCCGPVSLLRLGQSSGDKDERREDWQRGQKQDPQVQQDPQQDSFGRT